jgi:4-carboxymuconolactone decarboxylase
MTQPARPARLAGLSPDLLDDDQRRLYHDITGGPRGQGPFELTDDAGALTGPFNAMLLRPAIGSALQALGAAIRYRGALPARARELAILVVATHWDSGFERAAHEVIGRAEGLSEAELAAVLAGREPELADATERAALRAARVLVRAGDLDDRQYSEALVQLGAAGIFELTALVGYYGTLALQMRVFRAGAPPGNYDPAGPDTGRSTDGPA